MFSKLKCPKCNSIKKPWKELCASCLELEENFPTKDIMETIYGDTPKEESIEISPPEEPIVEKEIFKEKPKEKIIKEKTEVKKKTTIIKKEILEEESKKKSISTKKPIVKSTFDLNKQQQEAVNYFDSPLLIVAGPGTGKTRVITEKILKIIAKL